MMWKLNAPMILKNHLYEFKGHLIRGSVDDSYKSLGNALDILGQMAINEFYDDRDVSEMSNIIHVLMVAVNEDKVGYDEVDGLYNELLKHIDKKFSLSEVKTNPSWKSYKLHEVDGDFYYKGYMTGWKEKSVDEVGLVKALYDIILFMSRKSIKEFADEMEEELTISVDEFLEILRRGIRLNEEELVHVISYMLWFESHHWGDVWKYHDMADNEDRIKEFFDGYIRRLYSNYDDDFFDWFLKRTNNYIMSFFDIPRKDDLIMSKLHEPFEMSERIIKDNLNNILKGDFDNLEDIFLIIKESINMVLRAPYAAALGLDFKLESYELYENYKKSKLINRTETMVYVDGQRLKYEGVAVEEWESDGSKDYNHKATVFSHGSGWLSFDIPIMYEGRYLEDDEYIIEEVVDGLENVYVLFRLTKKLHEKYFITSYSKIDGTISKFGKEDCIEFGHGFDWEVNPFNGVIDTIYDYDMGKELFIVNAGLYSSIGDKIFPGILIIGVDYWGGKSRCLWFERFEDWKGFNFGNREVLEYDKDVCGVYSGKRMIKLKDGKGIPLGHVSFVVSTEVKKGSFIVYRDDILTVKISRDAVYKDHSIDFDAEIVDFYQFEDDDYNSIRSMAYDDMSGRLFLLYGNLDTHNIPGMLFSFHPADRKTVWSQKMIDDISLFCIDVHEDVIYALTMPDILSRNTEIYKIKPNLGFSDGFKDVIRLPMDLSNFGPNSPKDIKVVWDDDDDGVNIYFSLFTKITDGTSVFGGVIDDMPNLKMLLKHKKPEDREHLGCKSLFKIKGRPASTQSEEVYVVPRDEDLYPGHELNPGWHKYDLKQKDGKFFYSGAVNNFKYEEITKDNFILFITDMFMYMEYPRMEEVVQDFEDSDVDFEELFDLFLDSVFTQKNIERAILWMFKGHHAYGMMSDVPWEDFVDTYLKRFFLKGYYDEVFKEDSKYGFFTYGDLYEQGFLEVLKREKLGKEIDRSFTKEYILKSDVAASIIKKWLKTDYCIVADDYCETFLRLLMDNVKYMLHGRGEEPGYHGLAGLVLIRIEDVLEEAFEKFKKGDKSVVDYDRFLSVSGFLDFNSTKITMKGYDLNHLSHKPNLLWSKDHEVDFMYWGQDALDEIIVGNRYVHYLHSEWRGAFSIYGFNKTSGELEYHIKGDEIIRKTGISVNFYYEHFQYAFIIGAYDTRLYLAVHFKNALLIVEVDKSSDALRYIDIDGVDEPDSVNAYKLQRGNYRSHLGENHDKDYYHTISAYTNDLGEEELISIEWSLHNYTEPPKQNLFPKTLTKELIKTYGTGKKGTMISFDFDRGILAILMRHESGGMHVYDLYIYDVLNETFYADKHKYTWDVSEATTITDIKLSGNILHIYYHNADVGSAYLASVDITKIDKKRERFFDLLSGDSIVHESEIQESLSFERKVMTADNYDVWFRTHKVDELDYTGIIEVWEQDTKQTTIIDGEKYAESLKRDSIVLDLEEYVWSTLEDESPLIDVIHNPPSNKGRLYDIVESYNEQVDWEDVIPPCRIASYNLATYLYDEEGYEDVKVVDGFVHDLPHYWVQVVKDGITYALDATNYSGVLIGTKEEMMRHGFYDNPDTTYYYDWSEDLDRMYCFDDVILVSDDPLNKKYKVKPLANYKMK